MPIGEKIREIREKLGYSQNEIARRAGIPHSTYHRIESGDRPDPQVSTIAKIAHALRVSIDEIIGSEFINLPIDIDFDYINARVAENPIVLDLDKPAPAESGPPKLTTVDELRILEHTTRINTSEIRNLKKQLALARKASQQSLELFEQIFRVLSLQGNAKVLESLADLKELTQH